MRSLIKSILVNFFSFLLFSTCISFSQDQEVGEILENIQKDLRTLERAVYSESFQKKSGGEATLTNKETEDVLTRHLLKKTDQPLTFLGQWFAFWCSTAKSTASPSQDQNRWTGDWAGLERSVNCGFSQHLSTPLSMMTSLLPSPFSNHLSIFCNFG